jgi:molecular chaperone DnaK (HSP70)
MPGRVGIDFGTSNTVVAVWDAERREGTPLHLSGYGKKIHYRRGTDDAERISIIPSVIYYATNRRRWLGQQVLTRDLYESKRTFRWMKRYIARRSPVKVRLGDREISHFEAGRDFLASVLTSVKAQLDMGDEEVAFTVPVEAFEDYENWLIGVAESVGMPRFRLIDEPSAAALGYGAMVQPGDAYLVFDFGGGTLDVAVVLMEEVAGATPGRHCRVLGKAGAELGGDSVDQWLYQEVLRRNQRSEADDAVRRLSRELLAKCETLKEELTFAEEADIQVLDPESGTALSASFTRGQFEEILDQHDAFAQVDAALRKALNATRERGYNEEDIRSVLLVGGSSMIPSVQRTVQRIFGRERVLFHRPLDAVARGAAAFVAGVDFQDYIQHDYAIRFVDPARGDYCYHPIIPHGTRYPTAEPAARLTVKASHDGQAQLGIAVFELGEKRSTAAENQVELIFDVSGAARVAPISADEEQSRSIFWINEDHPTFLEASPPAMKGEPRFDVEFGIDGNKRLLITVRDIKTKQVTHRNHPVVRLT